MKTSRTVAGLVLPCILFTCPVLGGITVGKGEVILAATASATYDSNVSGNRNSGEDYYGTFAPRISYLRRAGKIEADASAGFTSTRYLDHKEFDSDNPSGNLTLRLSEKSFENISAAVSANYRETYAINPDLNARIESTTTTFSTRLGLVTGVRTSLSLHGSYSNSEHSGVIASDQEFWTGGGAFNYSDFIGRNTLILSYDYTNAKSSGNNLRGADLNQNSHLFSVGLSRPLYHEVTGRVSYGYRILNRSAAETNAGITRQTGTVLSAGIDGPFLPHRLFPKIKSRASISYQEATTPGINDPGTKQVTGDASLSWEARETTSVSLGVSRSQRLAVTDISVVSTTARLALQQKLRHNLSGSVGANYVWNTYKGIARSDEVLSYDAALNYLFAHDWTASASYRYQSAKSDQRISEFVRHLAILSLGYTF